MCQLCLDPKRTCFMAFNFWWLLKFVIEFVILDVNNSSHLFERKVRHDFTGKSFQNSLYFVVGFWSQFLSLWRINRSCEPYLLLLRDDRTFHWGFFHFKRNDYSLGVITEFNWILLFISWFQLIYILVSCVRKLVTSPTDRKS